MRYVRIIQRGTVAGTNTEIELDGVNITDDVLTLSIAPLHPGHPVKVRLEFLSDLIDIEGEVVEKGETP